MNQKIVVAVFIIGGSGIIHAVVNKTAITPVIIGSYIFLLVASILDIFGGQASQFAGALALLAATYVLLTEFPWTQILGMVKGTSASSTAKK